MTARRAFFFIDIDKAAKGRPFSWPWLGCFHDKGKGSGAAGPFHQITLLT